MTLKPYFKTKDFTLYHGNNIDIINKLNIKPSFVFVDPPYFLSSEGFTVQSGKIVSVHKGEWDKLDGLSIDDFNHKWLTEARNLMSKNGTICVSGTFHNIFSIAQILKELNFKTLNIITWQKTNPPPNFSTRSFTHSTEILIWARKDIKTPHYFNYLLMKKFNDNKQMTDVWRLPAIAPWEKKNKKHITQKPLSILSRIILASTKKGDLVFDPFSGSSTTGIAANLLGRNFVGIEIDKESLNLSIKRKKELETWDKKQIINKISGLDYELIQKYDK